MRLQIHLTEAMREALIERATRERRNLKQQVEYLLEQVVLGDEPRQLASTADREVAHAQTEG